MLVQLINVLKLLKIMKNIKILLKLFLMDSIMKSMSIKIYNRFSENHAIFKILLQREKNIPRQKIGEEISGGGNGENLECHFENTSTKKYLR